MIRSLHIIASTPRSRQEQGHAICYFSGFSRLLDLGGSPTEHSTTKLVRTINASKNSKIQAVCFDFDVLTRNVKESQKQQEQEAVTPSSETVATTATTSTSRMQPDLTAVQTVAKLLNVNLDATTASRRDKLSLKEERDLERMMGEDKTGSDAATTTSTTRKPAPKNYNPFDNDIRSKYAAKLAQKGASPTTSTTTTNTTSSRGDASFHLAARAAAVTEHASTGGNKWLAQTGTGALLQYLTRRSIYLALLATPAGSSNSNTASASSSSSSLQTMQDFQTQVKSTVVIDVLAANTNSQQSAQQLLQSTLSDLHYSQEPSQVLVVSDRDDYLRAAKDLQCMTCRIHRQGQPRGNVSAHYTVPDLAQVQTVVDELNGISYSALNSKSTRR